MTVTVLLENTTCTPNLTAEHGLSLYIETNHRRILFDMGQTDLFVRNADTLGIDLSTVDTAILSHGHYDHGGGLPAFLARNQAAPVYISRHAFGRYCNGIGKYIGLDPALQGHPRLILTHGETNLGDGLTLYADTPLPTICDLGTFGLTSETDGVRTPDPFRHEQYLSIREHGDGGRHVLISGCSHKGIRNIVQWFRPDALIGGFHFMNVALDDEGKAVLDSAADALAAYGTEYFTCHCTGKAQFDHLKARMGERLHYLAGGMSVEL